MPNCQKLWSIWFITYLIVINVYLTVVSIKDYLDFKYQIFDLAYGGNWNTVSIYLILGCLNTSLALLPIIIYTSLVPQNNLANDGHILGRDPDVFQLTVTEHGKGRIMPASSKKSVCLKNNSIRLIYMEMPPLCYFLQVISAMCFLVPKAFIDGQRIQHGVIRHNLIWHSDLDFLFNPSQQHSEFVFYPMESYNQPVSVAYFNLGISLFLLSLQYSRVLWYISRKFTILLSFIMLLGTVHILVEHCSISVMIKISLNPTAVGDHLKLSIDAFNIQFLAIGANFILLCSFTSVFHYGVLQYADMMIYRNRKLRRQMLNTSSHIIESNHLDISGGGAFSPSISENYSDSSMDALFSKSHVSHLVAILCLCVWAGLKSTNIYLSFVHLYRTTSDTLTLVNILISGLYMIVWLILWFALALRRNWNFKLRSVQKFRTEPHFLNGNTVINHSGTIQLHQVHNSLLRSVKSSEINLSKQDMMALNRNVGLDAGSDDTDMSSKMSSNNYVFLQSMRNSQLNTLEHHQAMLRNPLLLSYAVNNQPLQNSNTIYANDDSINNRSLQIDDQLDSEHSYNSSRSRNMAFENLPPILPNFDENRYKIPNVVSMEKLIPRYLRNQSLDYNNFVHFSVPSSELILPTGASPTMSCPYDTGIQTFGNNSGNLSRFKPTGFGNQMTPIDKYSTLLSSAKSSLEPMDFMMQHSDDDLQPRSMINGDNAVKAVFDQRRVVKSSTMGPTLEESITDNMNTENECLLQLYNNLHDGNDIIVPVNSEREKSMELNNLESLTERMCSQV